MINLVLLLVIALAWAVSLSRGLNFVFVAVFTFTIYSIPALLGLVFPFHFNLAAGADLIAASFTAVLVTLVAWIVFVWTILFTGKRQSWVPVSRSESEKLSEPALVYSLLILCVLGYAGIAAQEGPLWFLKARDDQTETFLRLLWRWVNAAGLVASVCARSWRSAVAFTVALLVYFVAGDRTVLTITAFAVAVAMVREPNILRVASNPKFLLLAASTVVLGILGKPIYLSIKAGDVSIFLSAFADEYVSASVTAFEPFLTFNILDLVVRYDFEMPIATLLEGVVGQLLIIPSWFGIDSNSFNVEFTSRFAGMLTYGIAGNYWAQAYSIGGYGFVALFAFMYARAVIVLDALRSRWDGAPRVGAILAAAILSVYIHRNSLDNVLSLVRQIVVVCVVAALLSRLIVPVSGRNKRRPLRASVKSRSSGPD